MLIVWGKRTGRRREGRWADFCTICRQVAPFQIVALYSYRHFYFIPVSRSECHAFEATCEQCGLRRYRERAADRPISAARNESLDALISKTWPDSHRFMSERADLERRVAAGRLRREERDALIREVLCELEPEITARAGEMHIDWVSGVLFLVAAVGTIALIAFGTSGVSRAADENWTFAAVYACVMFTLALGSVAIDARRYFKRRIAPLIVRGLAPLRVSSEDIERVLADLKLRKFTIERFIRPTAIVADIERRELLKARGL